MATATPRPTCAQKLRALREKAGMTVEALAEKSGVPAKLIDYYEGGRKRRPLCSRLDKLAAALGTDRAGIPECECTDGPAQSLQALATLSERRLAKANRPLQPAPLEHDEANPPPAALPPTNREADR
jgi:transcriptional regulator with XRE-family HTH domain